MESLHAKTNRKKIKEPCTSTWAAASLTNTDRSFLIAACAAISRKRKRALNHLGIVPNVAALLVHVVLALWREFCLLAVRVDRQAHFFGPKIMDPLVYWVSNFYSYNYLCHPSYHQ